MAMANDQTVKPEPSQGPDSVFYSVTASPTQPGGEGYSEPEGEGISDSEPDRETNPEEETKSESEPVGQNTPSPESEGETNPESQPEGKPIPESEPEGQTNPDAEVETTPESEPEGEPNPESVWETNPESEAGGGIEAKGETNPESEAQRENNPESEAEGETNPESEAEGQTNPESEAEGENNPDSEPGMSETEGYPEDSAAEAESEAQAEGEPEAWPEAGPEWQKAKSLWQQAWPFHVYLFSLCYLAIAAVSLYTVVSSIFRKNRRTTSMGRTAIALNVMVFSFAITRAAFLLTDPYFSESNVPFIAARLLWSFGIPGFTASFSIMLLILLDTTKMSLGPPRFQRLGTVIIIWCVHLLIVTTTDLLVFYVKADVRPLLVMCQMLFVVYGALLGIGYAYVGLKMRSNLKASTSKYTGDDQAGRLRFLLRTTFLSSLVSVSVAILNIYTIASDFGPYAGVKFVEAWTYWAVQTISRFLEVAACCLVLALFFRSGKGDHSKLTLCCWKRHTAISPLKMVSPSATRFTLSQPAVTGIKWAQRTDSDQEELH